MSKRTFQPNNRRRAKVHGFRLRMRTRAGRALVVARAAPSSPHSSDRSGSVLARAERLVSAADYKRVVRRGRRASSALMTVYSTAGSTPATWRYGFIVSKAVGNAVVRNRVRRRLKAVCHSMQAGHGSNAASFDVVVRAHPSAASASFGELELDVTALVERSTSVTSGSRR
jgi:ribonuclease P protein component